MDPDEKVAADVNEHGWHVVKVLSEGTQPPFAYTIGLETTFDHPETIIFGLNDDLDVMHIVLNEIGSLVREGARFEHGATAATLLPGYVCPFARFPRSAFAAHVGRAIHFHRARRAGFRVVQCIWPDTSNRLPWDSRFTPWVLRRQPVFLRPDAGPTDPEWPFEDPHSRTVLSTLPVVESREPIRFIGRDGEGEWRMVCETTSAEEDIVVATLGWAMDHDPSVAAAARLQPRRCLRRESLTAPWTEGPMARV